MKLETILLLLTYNFFYISKPQIASLSALNKGDSLMYSYCISCYESSNGSIVDANCQ